MSSQSADKLLPERIVDVQQALAGRHPGFRPVHAKGIVCAGTFEAAPEARRVSRARHLGGGPIAATIRFANSSGDPGVHDGQPSVRSMSVKFALPGGGAGGGGGQTDLLANSVDGFPVRTAEEFLEFLKLNLPDPGTGKADPDAVPRFLKSHPPAMGFVGRLMQNAVPASYAQASYHAIHAFRFTAADGSSRFGRYHWRPEAGEAYVQPEAAAQRDRDFLRTELAARLAKGPAVFRLELQIAHPGDATDDATALWPADRAVVPLGRLSVASISASSAADERRLVFDPTNLTDGIELSEDPIPRVRSAAYSVSFGRRSKGN